LDAQLQQELASWLGSRFGVTVKHLREIGLREADDNVLIAAAKRFGDIVIMTKDVEFVEKVRKAGPPPRMVWLRCGNLTALETQMWLSRAFGDVLAKLDAGDAIVEVPGPSA
jgi:predicted nuclease of predicted toxin-antitoxin system